MARVGSSARSISLRSRRTTVSAPPARVSAGCRFRPSLRATMFGPAGTPPMAHVGRVDVRTSRFDGHLTGIRAGRTGTFAPRTIGSPNAAFRSGSLGRVHAGGFSGG